jgi:hypothetical protein
MHARRRICWLVSLVVLVVSTGANVGSVQALPLGEYPAPPPIDAVGVVEHDGRLLLAELYLSIPPGADENAIARQALEAVGARPMTSADRFVFGFSTNPGVLWDQFFDRHRQNDSVIQYYNPTNDPTGGGGLQALRNSHATWNDVRTSSFTFEFGDVQCPVMMRSPRCSRPVKAPSPLSRSKLSV